MMERIRAFIAVELPEALKRDLARLEASLKTSGPSQVKWVSPEGIHLTLKFLGGVEADRIAEIVRAMQAAAAGVHPFSLEVEELGVFPNWRRVQVIWVGLAGDLEALLRLQQSLDANLEGLGFPVEKRPFTPHLTLARVREEATSEERQALGNLLAAASFHTDCAIRVDAVSLMRSELTRAGAIYSRLGSVPLS